MQKQNDGWVRCPRCNHKLFRVLTDNSHIANIEIKCSSCRAIVTFDASGNPKKGDFKASAEKVDKVID